MAVERRSRSRPFAAAEARQAQIGSPDDARFAVLGTNGRISFVTHS
ncbi:MAG TPA: hypothetical protein VFR49_15975 [Solirubrobacteraceae bacterium]|nr:hypothetical protein [Solirubrobacteraceae bacterium]